jgi:Cytidylyltransferase-like
MNIIVVYPGRFHPFHLGHKASYNWLTDKFGDGVYIATSNVQNNTDSPFSYADKVRMITKLGIPASHVVQTRNPYQVREITDSLSPEEKATTALVFAVSAKDAERFNFKPKKSGEPSYLQPLPENLKKLKPMSQQGYVTVTPTVNFRVKGVDANSASQIRNLYQQGNEADHANIITDLYGAADPELQAVFDQRLAKKTEEIITYGQEILDGGTVDGGMRESRKVKLQRLNQRINHLQQLIKEHRITPFNPDYIDEKNRR